MAETRAQQRIRELLDEKEQEQEHDNSLQGKALDRALGQQIPRTLTPWEWQQWYAEHGQPEEHRRRNSVRRARWWQRLLRRA